MVYFSLLTFKNHLIFLLFNIINLVNKKYLRIKSQTPSQQNAFSVEGIESNKCIMCTLLATYVLIELFPMILLLFTVDENIFITTFDTNIDKLHYCNPLQYPILLLRLSSPFFFFFWSHKRPSCRAHRLKKLSVQRQDQ